MMNIYLTVPQAVEKSGFTKEHVRYLARTGRIEAIRFGQVWAVDPDSLDAYLATERKRGPKRRAELERRANAL